MHSFSVLCSCTFTQLVKLLRYNPTHYHHSNATFTSCQLSLSCPAANVTQHKHTESIMLLSETGSTQFPVSKRGATMMRALR